ncbi:MAG: hypothetical protein OEZ22_01375 [Spirochaetia bacterium]|nr:hypothetical protein [Spirochaetia bacterium]
MNLLSRIIYASDYLASSYINNIEDLKKKNINEICLIKTNVTISFLKKQKKPIFKDTLNFLNWIKNQ